MRHCTMCVAAAGIFDGGERPNSRQCANGPPVACCAALRAPSPDGTTIDGVRRSRARTPDFMPPQADHTSRVEALDLLRLAAVLAVVLYHFGFWGPAHQTAIPSMASFAKYGFLGVPVFFIISGFVIAYSAEGRTATGFAIARFSRIYPTFVFCMTLTFLALL